MKCPNDQTTLAMTERQGIEIDYCPTCRGVWLDRGELDKLIDAGGSREARSVPPSHEQGNSYRHDRDDNDRQHEYGKKHKRESFLGEIFDF